MTFNSEEIIQDVRTEFEHLLEFVTGEEARTAKADMIERGLFNMLLKLGAKLLQLFIIISDNNHSVRMFRHDDVRPQFHEREMFGDGAPNSSAIFPKSFNSISPFTTFPNKHSRRHATTVTKYAPGWE